MDALLSNILDSACETRGLSTETLFAKINAAQPDPKLTRIVSDLSLPADQSEFVARFFSAQLAAEPSPDLSQFEPLFKTFITPDLFFSENWKAHFISLTGMMMNQYWIGRVPPLFRTVQALEARIKALENKL